MKIKCKNATSAQMCNLQKRSKWIEKCLYFVCQKYFGIILCSLAHFSDHRRICKSWKSSIVSKKIIFDEEYIGYNNDGLFKLNLDTISERRITWFKIFVKETVGNSHKSMFLINEASPSLLTGTHEKFQVNMALTERYKNSDIPQMHRMLKTSRTSSVILIVLCCLTVFSLCNKLSLSKRMNTNSRFLFYYILVQFPAQCSQLWARASVNCI